MGSFRGVVGGGKWETVEIAAPATLDITLVTSQEPVEVIGVTAVVEWDLVGSKLRDETTGVGFQGSQGA